MTLFPFAGKASSRTRCGRGAPRSRIFGVGLALLALAATVLMPLVVVCRTYKALSLGEVPPCCSGKKSCAPEPGADSIGTGEVDCPYCKAAAPFRHAHPQWTPTFLAKWTQLHTEAPVLPRSHPGAPPDLIDSQPRAPPLPV
ncbi:MAG: hypothetical protein P1P84_15885 [Deferrisomatales bacterium]|nr:hypothetical protein [Deferrisomatales bacterium]